MANKQLETRTRTFPACCDIYEEKDKIFLKLEMPGVTKGNLDIKIDGDQLEIHGKRPSAEEKGPWLIREIPEGDFHQSYTIDDTIDRNKIDASLEKGILTVTLHLKESEKPRAEITAYDNSKFMQKEVPA